MLKRKIAICHYRVGNTDGVSLEIEKRKQILEKHGCEVKLIAGNQSKGADYIIKELEWDDGMVPIIKKNSFLYFDRRDLDDTEFRKKINIVSRTIENKLSRIQLKENFNAVLIHNIFSFGGHIAAAKAFTKWIEEFKIPTIATHHDFYWERKEFHMPRNSYLKNYMKKFMPPQSRYIKHVVINSLAKKELRKRNNIESLVMPDVFNFNQKEWEKDSFNKDFFSQFDIKPNDLILLQATRIIPRKGIEIAIDFTKVLQQGINKIRKKRLYNGKKLTSHSNTVMIMAGYAENEKYDYLYKLKSKAFDQRVNIKFISSQIKAHRTFRQGIKTFSLWDTYVYADMVIYPSIWEGWGNQFIESVFAKKPIIIYEYPVFRQDIKKEGYKFISLGSSLAGKDENGLQKIPQKNINKAVRQSINWLLDNNLNKKLEDNFKIGKKFHGYKILEDFLVKELDL